MRIKPQTSPSAQGEGSSQTACHKRLPRVFRHEVEFLSARVCSGKITDFQ